jgi:thymidylate synthase ThyX
MSTEKIWDVSPYFLSDDPASRKSTLTEKRKAGFIPSKNIAIGTEGIQVKLISMTNLEEFKKPLAYMVNATVGGSPSEEEIDRISEEIFDGGLQHALESIICIFEISGVSRAFTHQVVRHRQWGFHQQSFRWSGLSESNIGIRISPHIAKNPELFEKVKKHFEETKRLYSEIVDADVPFQDARDLLPIGSQTYIIAECSLKEFMKTFSYRGCSMFQPQMVYVMWKMREEIIKVYPKLEKFLVLSCEKNNTCMYQGWESSDKACSLEQAKKRQFKSSVYK